MILYCVQDIMSRCIADDWDEQRRCYYSEKASEGNRCMYKITALDNHCDCQAAQQKAREIASGMPNEELEPDISEEEELDIEDFLEEEMPDLASCTNCYRFIHCHTQPPGYAETEMEMAAATCAAYRKKADWEKKQKQLPF